MGSYLFNKKEKRKKERKKRERERERNMIKGKKSHLLSFPFVV